MCILKDFFFLFYEVYFYYLDCYFEDKKNYELGY